MATTTKILATANRYGSTGGSVPNSYAYNGRAYVGRSEENRVYRSRLTFPSIRSLAAIGDANIVITKVTLHLRRHSGGACDVTAGSSADSAWGATTDGSGSFNIAAQSAWYTIDITDCAQAILNYPGNWYIHLTGSGTRVCCYGVEDGFTAYINVVWEYSANTLTTDVESVPLGDAVAFTIDPQEGDARYVLTYESGDEIGSIADTSSTVITWTPPLGFAAELPNADSGELQITMKVYDADGAQVRTEVLYLTVTVPETAVPTITDMGVTLINALGGYALTGKTYATISPIIDIDGTYGASISSVKADIADGNVTQTLTWDTLTETDAGVFEGAAQATNILLNVGSAVITLVVTDSRGREIRKRHVIDVRAYANPLITEFTVDRYEPIYDADEQITGYTPSDVGENVWVTLVASCSDIVGLNSISWKITAKGSDGTVTEYSGSNSETEIDIYEDRTIITAPISAAISVEYTVQVVDTAGYEAAQYDNITPGRANFALAASKHGASFGCLPKGTEAQPMLESAYPFYAYGGIHGVTNYTTDEVKTGGTWVDGKSIYRKSVYVAYTASAAMSVAAFPEADVIIDIEGYLYDVYENRSACYPQTFYYSSSNYLTTWVTVENSINIKGTRNLSGYLTVYYTKTVDEEPGSGEGDETVTPVTYPTVALASANSSGYVVRASSEYSSKYAAWKAFNKSYSDAQGWASSASDNAPWLYIELPKAIRIRSIRIANRTFNSGVNGVINARVNATNDTSAWTQLGTISGRDGATSGLVTTHEISSGDVAYKYVGIDPTSWNKDAGSYVSIGEIYITGFE